MKTYTPDEYRQMAERRQFGVCLVSGNTMYGWLVKYYEPYSLGNNMVQKFSVTPFSGGHEDDETWLSNHFIPRKEPKELQG